MEISYIEMGDISVYKIRHKPNNYWGLYVIFLFCIIGLLVPVIAMILIPKLNFGIIITTIILWSSSFYLLRLFLWNKYGQEVFLYSHHKINYYHDYKFFKLNQKEYTSQKPIHHNFVKNNSSIYKLIFIGDDFELTSIFELSKNDINTMLRFTEK